MTSGAPAECCITGFRHQGTPTGEVKLVGKIHTYFAYPESKSTKLGILILTDVLGYGLPNIQLIADQFAANGYFVVMPDLFRGDPVKLEPGLIPGPGFNFNEWLGRHQEDTVDPIVKEVLGVMKQDYGVEKIGAVGYCFGARYAVRFLPSDIACAYIAHPAHVGPEELRAIKGPLSITACEFDDVFTVEERHKSEAILREIDVPYQINLFSKVKHGFAVRGDPSVRIIRWSKEQAFYQAVQWFDEYLKGGN